MNISVSCERERGDGPIVQCVGLTRPCASFQFDIGSRRYAVQVQ